MSIIIKETKKDWLTLADTGMYANAEDALEKSKELAKEAEQNAVFYVCGIEYKVFSNLITKKSNG